MLLAAMKALRPLRNPRREMEVCSGFFSFVIVFLY
jgi:hypothetical protein